MQRAVRIEARRPWRKLLIAWGLIARAAPCGTALAWLVLVSVTGPARSRRAPRSEDPATNVLLHRAGVEGRAEREG